VSEIRGEQIWKTTLSIEKDKDILN